VREEREMRELPLVTCVCGVSFVSLAARKCWGCIERDINRVPMSETEAMILLAASERQAVA
jgi:hypothetical protein